MAGAEVYEPPANLAEIALSPGCSELNGATQIKPVKFQMKCTAGN